MCFTILAGLSVMLASTAPQEKDLSPQVGDPVPEFRLLGSDNEWYEPSPELAMIIA